MLAAGAVGACGGERLACWLWCSGAALRACWCLAIAPWPADASLASLMPHLPFCCAVVNPLYALRYAGAEPAPAALQQGAAVFSVDR